MSAAHTVSLLAHGWLQMSSMPNREIKWILISNNYDKFTSLFIYLLLSVWNKGCPESHSWSVIPHYECTLRDLLRNTGPCLWRRRYIYFHNESFSLFKVGDNNNAHHHNNYDHLVTKNLNNSSGTVVRGINFPRS